MRPSFLLLIIILLIVGGKAFNPDDYNNKQTIIEGIYFIYWNIDTSNNSIHLALHVNTTGWVSNYHF